MRQSQRLGTDRELTILTPLGNTPASALSSATVAGASRASTTYGSMRKPYMPTKTFRWTRLRPPGHGSRDRSGPKRCGNLGGREHRRRAAWGRPDGDTQNRYPPQASQA
jgi:hypothetical protein